EDGLGGGAPHEADRHESERDAVHASVDGASAPGRQEGRDAPACNPPSDRLATILVRNSLAVTAVALLMAACASHGTSPKPAPTSRPEIVSVPQLQRMLEQGETVGAILGKIDGSGTVYRLSTEQRAALRASGMPAAILGKMEI